MFNCMVNKQNHSIDELHEVVLLKPKTTIASKFQHESKLDDAKILQMNGIFNDWVYLRFTRYTHVYKNTSSVQSSSLQTKFKESSSVELPSSQTKFKESSSVQLPYS